MLPTDSYLHLTSGWKVAYGAENTLAAITLSLSLVKEVREFFFPVCGKIPAQLLAALLQLLHVSRIIRKFTVELLSSKYSHTLLLWATMMINPFFPATSQSLVNNSSEQVW